MVGGGGERGRRAYVQVGLHRGATLAVGFVWSMRSMRFSCLLSHTYSKLFGSDLWLWPCWPCQQSAPHQYCGLKEGREGGNNIDPHDALSPYLIILYQT